jgi:hypothetical protein
VWLKKPKKTTVGVCKKENPMPPQRAKTLAPSRARVKKPSRAMARARRFMQRQGEKGGRPQSLDNGVLTQPKSAKGTPMNFEEQAIQAIKDLQQAHKRNLNRQLAFEALMGSMLERIHPDALEGLLEEYEAACDRLAAQLRPEMQEPDVWQQWSDAITERQKSLRALQLNTPGAD